MSGRRYDARLSFMDGEDTGIMVGRGGLQSMG